MTRFLTLLAGIMITQCAFAQLPDGSIAPDFTATDINGTTHNLQSYLDEGKSVVLLFDATWNDRLGSAAGRHRKTFIKLSDREVQMI